MISHPSESNTAEETARRLNAIKLYIEQPHLINKKIYGSELKWVGVGGICLDEGILAKLRSTLHNSNNDKLDCAIKILRNYKFEADEDEQGNVEYPWHKSQSLVQNLRVAIIRNIIPKCTKSQNSLTEVATIDYCCNKVMFIAEFNSQLPKVLPEFAYTINFTEEKLQLKTFTNHTEEDSGYIWLNSHLLPALNKWADQMEDIDFENRTASLHLIKLHEYTQTYKELKMKYGKFLQEIWNESTDPLKFIYEDIAIAAYIIVFWKQERKEKNLEEKQSFIDLGCGNGLLVYLLSSEGYRGMGIDIRRRKLWNDFPNHVCLKEEVIIPSDKHLYPNFDWLIGNHSDELTPWLPVIAAKSSMATRFFVIPCCAHDFQSKFQRKKSGISQYAEYLDYIEEIGNICGFEMWKDRLRIPSTKRACFIGQNRKYSSAKWEEVIRQINDFLGQKCLYETTLETDSKTDIQKSGQMKCQDKPVWCQGFKAKEPIQKIRNCTQIKTEVREKLVNEVAFLLLSQSNSIKVNRGDEWIDWNRGGKLSMKDLATVLDSQLKHLKNECGGLQTLLKNHKFIFETYAGFINLRVPESAEKKKVSHELVKTKKCWFHLHHPHGCVLKSEECTYLH